MSIAVRHRQISGAEPLRTSARGGMPSLPPGRVAAAVSQQVDRGGAARLHDERAATVLYRGALQPAPGAAVEENARGPLGDRPSHLRSARSHGHFIVYVVVAGQTGGVCGGVTVSTSRPETISLKTHPPHSPGTV